LHFDGFYTFVDVSAYKASHIIFLELHFDIVVLLNDLIDVFAVEIECFEQRGSINIAASI
jgi:hypothetical protein